jgi:hypothetical protein
MASTSTPTNTNTNPKKKNNKNNKKKPEPEPTQNENDILGMLNQVNELLRTNPDMVARVSKCVSSIMENKDIMDTLASEIQNTVETEPYDCVANIMKNESILNTITKELEKS